MKHTLLLAALLPLSALAQYRPSYSPAPSYSRPPTPASNYNSYYQAQVRNQQQYAHQQFQQQQAQQLRNMQSQQFYNQLRQRALAQPLLLPGRGGPAALQRPGRSFLEQAQWQRSTQARQQWLSERSPQQVAADQAYQLKAGQAAADQLAQLTQRQQQERLAHPPADAQQAAARQQEDSRQVSLLTVQSYRSVLMPGQLAAAQASQLPSAEARQHAQALTRELLDNDWWQQQPPVQLAGKLAAHSAAMTALTTELFGPAVAAAPAGATTAVAVAAPAGATPATAAVAGPAGAGSPGLDALFAHDTFDPQVAGRLIGEAAQADKLAASAPLLAAVQQLGATVAQAGPTTPADAKALRKATQASVRRVDAALRHYYLQVSKAGRLYQTQQDISDATAGYLADNGVPPDPQ